LPLLSLGMPGRSSFSSALSDMARDDGNSQQEIKGRLQ
jgi:hypothetical protein